MKNVFATSFLSIILAVSSICAMDNSDPFRATFMADNFEYQFNGEKSISWDTYAYAGYDVNKVYIYSEGKKAKHCSAESENQLVFLME
jgi:copper resistance protein B